MKIEADGADASRHRIIISGEIDITTFADFSRAIADARVSSATSRVIELESPGGSISAAMAIGGLVREGRFDTAVAIRGKCYSACVLILAAGVHRTVESGKVGVHRPYYDRGYYAPGAPSREVADVGPVTEGLHQYLASMGMQDGLMDAMMKVPSKFMRHLTSREVVTYGLDNSKPCEVVRVAVAAVEPEEVQPTAANAEEQELRPARKVKKSALRKNKKKMNVASRRSAQNIRQAQRLATPRVRVAALSSAKALKRELWSVR